MRTIILTKNKGAKANAKDVKYINHFNKLNTWYKNYMENIPFVEQVFKDK